MANPAGGVKPPTFEKALERLETIVREMESGELNLERLMACFEEGMGLVKFCSRTLNEVERKIEQLVQQGEQTTLAPFTLPDGTDEPAPGDGERPERGRPKTRPATGPE